MKPMHCSGCGRRFGWSLTTVGGFKFCSRICRTEPPAFENEERDAIAAELARRWKVTRVAKALDMSRQRVQQVVAQRAKLE